MSNPATDTHDFLSLTRELCGFNTGVVADGNEGLFARLGEELPFNVHRIPSGSQHNGWRVQDNWRVYEALLFKNGELIFDGTVHPLAVAQNSISFEGKLDWEALRPHLVTNPDLPDTHVYHCIWQIRNWDRGWALSVPHNIYRDLGPGDYEVRLRTESEPGEMLIGEHEKRGRSDKIILFNTNTCHPTMANDGFAADALLVRLFQWLAERDTHYTYRLILAPEHMGSVFYLRDRPRKEIERVAGCVFAEMPGTMDEITVASSFLGGHVLDKAFHNATRHFTQAYKWTPWRVGAGNDETVWESPGYEIPTVEVTRAKTPDYPYPEYHSSADNADLMDVGQMNEFYAMLQRVVETIEANAIAERHFDGLICLSNPDYDLYFERHDPSIDKSLTDDDEKWGHLLDSLLRYFDGSMSVLDIAEKHELPFHELLAYLRRFEEKGLITLRFAPIERLGISSKVPRSQPSILTN